MSLRRICSQRKSLSAQCRILTIVLDVCFQCQRLKFQYEVLSAFRIWFYFLKCCHFCSRDLSEKENIRIIKGCIPVRKREKGDKLKNQFATDHLLFYHFPVNPKGPCLISALVIKVLSFMISIKVKKVRGKVELTECTLCIFHPTMKFCDL